VKTDLRRLLKGRHAPELIKGGRILKVTADWDKKEVVVDMMGCCDMDGGVLFAVFIMPTAKRVVYLWEGEPDTLYIKEGGKWLFMDIRRRTS
jgi:hypothetical protein